MRGVISFFRLVSILLIFAGRAPGQAISEARQVREAQTIANWPAPLLWTPPAAKVPGGGRAEAAATASAPLPFIAITPCRMADTRGNGFSGAYGSPALVANATRSFTITGQCGIPVTAAAVSFNFAALDVGGAGDLRVFPAGGGVPLVSTLNYNANTPNIANAAVVPLGTGGAITVQADAVAIDLIIDVNGYYDNSGVITGVTAGTGLTGGGTSGNVNIGIAPGGVTSTELASNAVTSAKIAANAVTAGAIASGQVVKNVNGITDSVTIAGSGLITVNTAASTITVGGGGTPSGAFVLGKPNDTTLIGAGFSEIAPNLQDFWTATSTAGAPAGRKYHTAVWTGSKMIVWGGTDFVTPFNTGGRYDPVTDSWTSTSTTGAPAGRYSHTAVWTGSSMIVWGGNDFVTTFNTGGQYDPVFNSWTATPTAGGPPARRIHTAVWDAADGVMLVWGGVDGSNTALGDGGRLNVGLASWGLITTLNAPTARWGHTAIWTGTQMVVWGGVDFNGFSVNTGGRYTFSTFSWASVGIDAYTPTAREAHTAVWTGARMLVWGGTDGTLLNTGGQYDPVGDSWSFFSTVGAPTGRSGHTAVWTGTRMIIWGGSTSATGGQFDPAGPSWVPTATAGAPMGGRSGHTAVWTGSKMILWGGDSGNGANLNINTGSLWGLLSLYVKN